MVAEWIAALAAAGSASLVGAVTTDAWAQAKAGFTHLFGRGDARRQESAAGRLDATAQEILSGENTQGARQAQLAAWSTRLGDLLEDEPDAAAELCELIDRLSADLLESGQTRIQVAATGPAVVVGTGVANTGVVTGNVSTTGQ